MGQILETQRLTIRKLTYDDVPSLHQILGDRDIMKFYPSTYDLKQTEEWISRSLKSYEQNSFGLWAVAMKKSHQFIGQCGISLQNIDGENVPEIGYHIHKQYWNKGYATEASEACLNYGFQHLNFEKIFIHTYIENIPSQRIAEKIGMKRLKEYDKHLTSHNLIWKHLVYVMENKDFRNF